MISSKSLISAYLYIIIFFHHSLHRTPGISSSIAKYKRMPVISFRYCYPCKSFIRCHFSISSRNFEPFPHLRCSFFINNSTTSRVSSFSLKTTFPIISLFPFVKIYRLFSHVQAILCCSSTVLPVIAATPASSEYTYFLMNVSSFCCIL